MGAAFVIILAVFGGAAIMSFDAGLCLACGAVIGLTLLLLWRAGEPPVALLPISTQLAQIITPTIYSTLLGVPVENVSLHLGDVTAATWFGLAAIGCLSGGIYVSYLGSQNYGESLRREANALSPRCTFLFCALTIVFAAVFERLAELSEGLRQPLLAASGVQWIGVFALTCVCFAQKRNFGLLTVVLLIEITKGFTGFFGDFRLVFFVVLIGIACARPKPSPGTLAAGTAVAFLLIVLAAWWSAVKVDYRDYVSQGSRQQAVLVSVEDRLAYLVDKLLNVDPDTMSQGFDRLARRIGYIDFLSSTMRNVPARIPYGNGTQLGASILHVLQPRILFPDKPPLISDTELTERVSGIRFSQTSGRATSVSLGYLAELYMDFAVWGALAIVFGLGIVFGACLRSVMSVTSLPTIVKAGCAVMLAINLTEFGEALIKVIGGFVTAFAMILFLARLGLPQLLSVTGMLHPFKFEIAK